MYAIIEEGGHQYKVEEGQELQINYRDIAAGEPVTFDRVLAVRNDDGLRIGQPLVSGASVSAEVLGAVKGQKLTVQKFRRRKTLRRRTGHRQIYTTVKINQIVAG